MIDVHELLRMKEHEIDRVRKEIHALQVAAPLLSDSAEEYREVQRIQPQHDFESSLSSPPEDARAVDNLQTDNSFRETSPESDETNLESIPPKKSLLRDWFGRAAGE